MPVRPPVRESWPPPRCVAARPVGLEGHVDAHDVVGRRGRRSAVAPPRSARRREGPRPSSRATLGRVVAEPTKGSKRGTEPRVPCRHGSIQPREPSRTRRPDRHLRPRRCVWLARTRHPRLGRRHRPAARRRPPGPLRDQQLVPADRARSRPRWTASASPPRRRAELGHGRGPPGAARASGCSCVGGPGIVQAARAHGGRGRSTTGRPTPSWSASPVTSTTRRCAAPSRPCAGGARLIGTNDDATYPTPDGPIPGGGALLAAVATASGHDRSSPASPTSRWPHWCEPSSGRSGAGR